jgi:hypothetical protein
VCLQYTIKTRVLSSDSVSANPVPWAYILATTGARTVDNDFVDGPHYLSVALVDYVSPRDNPTSLAFTDTDPGASVVAGTVTIGLPSPGIEWEGGGPFLMHAPAHVVV